MIVRPRWLILFCAVLLPLPGAVAQSRLPQTTDEQILAEAPARIARHRMGDLVVVVQNQRGRPVSGAAVSVEQVRHDFLFGSNIFLLEPQDTSSLQQAYRSRFAALFNYATLPFYWGTFEKEKGQPQYARLEGMARWCREHDIITKGHPLIWHDVYPRWAPADAAQAIPLLRQRVTDLITRYKGLVNVWDVVNEANLAPKFKNGVGDWVRRDGPAPVVRTALGWAREAGSGASETFLYNDFDTGPDHVKLLGQLAAEGSLPDAIGIQSHMHRDTWPLSKVWEVCETFGRFGKPLHFTEVTVLSGPQRQFSSGHPPADWLTTPKGETRQADYVEKFYTVLFSHPAVRAITWWDLSDRQAWLGAPAGLLRPDMSPKPAYERLMKLIHHTWWTRAARKTGGQGNFHLRAFLGDYKIKVESRGRTRVVAAQVLKSEGRTVIRVKV